MEDEVNIKRMMCVMEEHVCEKTLEMNVEKLKMRRFSVEGERMKKIEWK